MGSWFQKPKQYSQNLLVATINYGGIINGPFEFFSGDSEDEEKLSDIFHKLMPLYTDLIGAFSFPKKDDDMIREMNEKNGNDPKPKDPFKWQIGKIDQSAQKERYTPVYNKEAGVQNGRLITQSRFLERWVQEGNKWNKDPKTLLLKFSSSEMQVMKGFDLIAYHAILKFIYEDKIKDEQSLKNQTIVENLDSSQYIDFMESCFSRDYLDEEKKIKRLMYVLNKNFHQELLDKEETMSGTKMIDVLFLQEPSVKLLARIKNEKNSNGQQIFHVSGDEDSVVIVARKGEKRFNKFYDMKDKEQQKIKKLNLEDWPIFLKTKEQQEKEYEQKKKKAQKQKQSIDALSLKTDNKKLDKKLFAIPETNILVCENFLFIGLHLSSKKEANKMQSKLFKQQLKYLNKFQNEYDIIAAGDINSYLDNKGVQNYKVYPGDPRWLTTNKKRTYMQAQYNKANEQVCECKDHIVTNANMVMSGVMTIEIVVATDKFLLPTSDHPFDHFMVVTLIKRRLANELIDGRNRLDVKKEQKDKEQKKYYAPLRMVSQ